MPRRMRRVLVSAVGASLIALGLALVVLPGPFTLPLVILGLGVLASEFVWAARLLERARERARRVRNRAAKRRGK